MSTEDYSEYTANTLTVRLYDDHLTWNAITLQGTENLNLSYKDIISVSYSDGWEWGEAFLEVNTAGKVYKYSAAEATKVAGRWDMKPIADAIQSKIDEASEEKAINTVNVVINSEEPEPTVVRIKDFIKNGDWINSIAYTRAAISLFPTDCRFYMLSLFNDYKVKTFSDLITDSNDYLDNYNFEMAYKYAKDDMKPVVDTLSDYGKKKKEIQHINSNIEKNEKTIETNHSIIAKDKNYLSEAGNSTNYVKSTNKNTFISSIAGSIAFFVIGGLGIYIDAIDEAPFLKIVGWISIICGVILTVLAFSQASKDKKSFHTDVLKTDAEKDYAQERITKNEKEIAQLEERNVDLKKQAEALEKEAKSVRYKIHSFGLQEI